MGARSQVSALVSITSRTNAVGRRADRRARLVGLVAALLRPGWGSRSTASSRTARRRWLELARESSVCPVSAGQRGQ